MFWNSFRKLLDFIVTKIFGIFSKHFLDLFPNVFRDLHLKFVGSHPDFLISSWFLKLPELFQISLQTDSYLYIFLRGGSVALEHIVSCWDVLITEVSETRHGPRLSWSLSVPPWILRQKQICICVFIFIYICVCICICISICRKMTQFLFALYLYLSETDTGPDYPDLYQRHCKYEAKAIIRLCLSL